MKEKILPYFVVLAIPLDLATWTPTPLSGPLPKFDQGLRGWKIETEDNVGGFGFLLDRPQKNTASVKASWSWKISRFPTVKHSVPFDKDNDDYAIRVGVLISNGDGGIPMMGPFRKIAAKKKDFDLSYVVFYGASSQQNSKCGESAQHDKIINCLIPSSTSKQKVQVEPLADLKKHYSLGSEDMKKLRIMGFWVIADSDNSDSSSEAELSDLKLHF